MTMALSPACLHIDTPPSPVGATTPASHLTTGIAPAESVDQRDDALAGTRRTDQAGRGTDGQLARISAEEHQRRAAIYHANRAFDEARGHWQAILTRYPQDSNVPAAMFGIGRSLFQERRYTEALPVFAKLGDTYPQVEAGRDGYYYVAATLLRMERAGEAAARYGAYVTKFPNGERIENAYLNVIDSLREAGKSEEALPWVTRTRERFAGKPAAVNALFARLRLEVARSDWPTALRTADELSRAPFARGVQTTPQELTYLRAYCLERAGQKSEAVKTYQSIPDAVSSYYGGLATARLDALGGEAKRSAAARMMRVRAEALRMKADYPTPHRESILRAVSGQSVDPRLMLAIMRQESGFNPLAKSPAAARGLMQFTADTAQKYAERAKLSNLKEDDLYRPEVSIQLAGVYLGELSGMFHGLPEAVAASYNGGEDNVARWVKRAVHTDPGIFTSEVGFTESKDYVIKVLANLRAYRQLYTEDLRPRR